MPECLTPCPINISGSKEEMLLDSGGQASISSRHLTTKMEHRKRASFCSIIMRPKYPHDVDGLEGDDSTRCLHE